MPIPLAERRGQLNAPQVQPGKVVSPAEEIANIGRIGANTLKLMSKASDDMGKAIIAKQRSDEQLKAQDALTEYLAGREKLDTVRQSMTLENALNFEDEYYKQAEKMHSEFVNKINSLQYADIRERVRGQANNTNIQTAAQAENYFWKEQEKVKDNHTDGLVDARIRQVVNSVNSNPGMEGYNRGNIANGYAFVLDTLKNRFMEKGYGEGTPEMDLAMSEAKDRYFTQVLEEISHRPDDGLAIAHKMGVVFKKQMTPEAYNKVMKPISANNLAMELSKDPVRFFMNGDTINGRTNDKVAAQYADALDPWERTKFLEAFQEKERQGHNAAKAAQDTAFSLEFRMREGEKLMGMLGDSLGLIPGEGELKDLSPERTKLISAQVRKNANAKDIANMLVLWEHAIDGDIYAYKLPDGSTQYAAGAQDIPSEFQPIALTLTNEDKAVMRSRMSVLTKLLFDDPEVRNKGLAATWFSGKKPDAQEVAVASMLQQAYNSSQKKRWYNFFGMLGDDPVEQVGYSAVRDLMRIATSTGAQYGDTAFDDLNAEQQRKFWNELAVKGERAVGAKYMNKFSADAARRDYQDAPYVGIFRDIRGTSRDDNPTFARRVYNSFEDATGASVGRFITGVGLETLYRGTKFLGENAARNTMPRAVMKKPNQRGFAKEAAMLSSMNNIAMNNDSFVDLEK